MDLLGLSAHSKKEDSSGKDSKNEKEGQKPPRGNGLASMAPAGEKSSGKGKGPAARMRKNPD